MATGPLLAFCVRRENPSGQEPDDTVATRPADRRRATRTAHDWESIALLRVASRVRSLTEPGSQAREDRAAEGFGWEETALRNLSRRLRDRGAC